MGRKFTPLLERGRLVPRRKSRTTSGNGTRHLLPSPINSQPNRPRFPATSSARLPPLPSGQHLSDSFYSIRRLDIHPSRPRSPIFAARRRTNPIEKNNKIIKSKREQTNQRLSVVEKLVLASNFPSCVSIILVSEFVYM